MRACVHVYVSVCMCILVEKGFLFNDGDDVTWYIIIFVEPSVACM